MNSSGRFSVAVVIFFFGAVGCGPQVANREGVGEVVVCFGDSLTQGIGAASGEDYPSRLAQSLGREVVNAGVSGNTTADGLARLDQDVLTHHPRVVVVCFGGNDFLRRVPRDQIFTNLDTIVRRIQAGGAAVVLAGVRSGLFGGSTKADFKRIARERGTLFIPDLLDGIFGRPSLMSDGIHPNREGYAIIAKRVEKQVRKIMK